MHLIYFLIQVIRLCADKSYIHTVMPTVQNGHCCSPATEEMGSFHSENMLLYLQGLLS